MGLADAGLAGDEHDVAVAGPGGGATWRATVEVLGPTNDRRVGHRGDGVGQADGGRRQPRRLAGRRGAGGGRFDGGAAGQVGIDHGEDLLAAGQVAQLAEAEVGQGDPARKGVAGEIGGGAGQHDLVRCGRPSAGATARFDRAAEVVAVADLGLAGVDRHPHRHARGRPAPVARRRAAATASVARANTLNVASPSPLASSSRPSWDSTALAMTASCRSRRGRPWRRGRPPTGPSNPRRRSGGR